jgi:hypothetical protein
LEGDDNEEFDEDAWMTDLYEQAMAGAIDFDDIMTSATHARRSQGVDAEHLSKIWRISVEEANRTLEITTQEKVHVDNPKLARNYGTNDRMLRYKRIGVYFSWTLSLRPKLLASLQGGTRVANYL